MSLLLFGHFLVLDSFLKLNTKVQRFKHQDPAMKSPHLITLIKMPNQNLPSHPSSFWHRSPFLLTISIARLFAAISAPFRSRHIVSLTWLIKGSLWVENWCLGVVCDFSGIQWSVFLHVPSLLYSTNDFETNSALYLEWSHCSLIGLIHLKPAFVTLQKYFQGASTGSYILSITLNSTSVKHFQKSDKSVLKSHSLLGVVLSIEERMINKNSMWAFKEHIVNGLSLGVHWKL